MTKLSRIEVRNLFGIFHHEIRLNDESGITIVIGENGLGKTVLLEMVEAFFKGNYMRFSDIIFDELLLEFSDRVVWKVRRSKTTPFANLELLEEIDGKESEPFHLISFDPHETRRLAHDLARADPNLVRLASGKFRDLQTDEVLTQWDLLFRRQMNYYQASLFSDQVDLDVSESPFAFPEWFKTRHPLIKVFLIETQRLVQLAAGKEEKHRKTVERYSEDLVAIIKKTLSESTELSASLDRSYPNRLVSRIGHASSEPERVLSSDLAALEEKREVLDKVGLIEIGKDPLIEINDPDGVLKEVLVLYVEDSFKKLAIYDDLANKITLLLKIINSRFKHKRLRVHKDEGLVIESTILKTAEGNEKRIPVSKLSSGEQNELVLFFFLLFKAEPNSLILIDEPEVSLHISWQISFISDLREITSLNKVSVLIATHSPDIIGNNWDLKVELKGVE